MELKDIDNTTKVVDITVDKSLIKDSIRNHMDMIVDSFIEMMLRDIPEPYGNLKIFRAGNGSRSTILEEEFQKDYFVELKNILEKEYENYTVYPPKKDILNAFFLTPYSEVKVVLLGQDPYHQKGQAHGLAFSVNYGIKTPPSLLNMYKELHDDLGLYIPNNGFLEKWAKQGVLLLNTSLTVRDSEANSHSKIGWQTFTDNIIKKLNEREKPIIFILWGNNAKSKEKFIIYSFIQ